MKEQIKMATSVSTVHHSFGGGEIIDVEKIGKTLAEQWLKQGIAVHVGQALPEAPKAVTVESVSPKASVPPAADAAPVAPKENLKPATSKNRR